jgi:hypothetical protein
MTMRIGHGYDVHACGQGKPDRASVAPLSSAILA